MNPNPEKARPRRDAGFTLPAILVVVAALLVMVIGLLAMSGIERKTARSYVDLQRADMAAQAGLEQVKAILDKETANDDFLVVQDVPKIPDGGNLALEAAPYLYIARGETTTGTSVKFRYAPLYSTATEVTETSSTKVDPPDASQLVGSDPKEIKVFPWSNPARTAWIPIKARKNGKDQTIARYAYWVEDLQGKINPKVAGNLSPTKNGLPIRSSWPFPAPGLRNPSNDYPNPFLDEKEPALNGIALFALDPASTDTPKADLTKKIIDGRDTMLSPDSILAASGYAAPLTRGDDGLLSDKTASILERNVSPVIHSYDEHPVIPFAEGISKDSVGKPKLNLNKLLGESRDTAIGEFATHVDKALPNFAKKSGTTYDPDSRPGLFPDDYLKTLAAGAFDYADADSEPSVAMGTYRGLDASPVVSEIVLKFDYAKHEIDKNGDLILTFNLRLYAELWNMTNQTVNGRAQVTYEVGLNRSPIGSGVAGLAFDDVNLLADRNQVTFNNNLGLVKIGDGYYSTPIQVNNLLPDQYKFYKFADLTYRLNVSANKDVGKYESTKFSFTEPLSKARGLTLRWNDRDVDRVPKLLRDPGQGTDGVFAIDYPVKTVPIKPWAKASQVGGSYGSFASFYVNNMGDPRIAYYIRQTENDQNSYPQNLSPNRRNLRRGSIYDGNNDLFYGRVLPSEWPDRGHDSPYGIFNSIPDANVNAVPDDPAYYYTAKPPEGNAPQRISNAGQFFSATELGNVYDPIMWKMAYDDIVGQPNSGDRDTKLLYIAKPVMPASRHVFPDVTNASTPSNNVGGGNTLRIGRYEHQKFDKAGMRASYLLDLFHAGKSLSKKSTEREGDLIEINGQVNINTAPRDALRAMAAGILNQDPRIARVTSWAHDVKKGKMAPTISEKPLGTPTTTAAADIVADAIIENRPYAAMGELSSIKALKTKQPVFGNPAIYPNETDIVWSDSAAEELFDRLYEAGTFRSRNFRVWVIGQALTGSEANPEILAETRKVYTVFADPGKRSAQGDINASENKSRVTYENNF